MYVCKNCGQTHPSPVSFCNRCGSNAIENRAEGAPSYPTYGTTPTYAYGTPTPSEGSKAPAIIGMVFGFLALIISFIMIGAASEISDSMSYPFYGSYYDADEIMSMLFAFSIFTLPFSIIGLVMSCKAKALRGMGIAGRIINIFSLVLWGIACIIMLSAL